MRISPKTGQTYPLDTGGMGGYGAGSGGRPAPGGYDINPYGSMGPPTVCFSVPLYCARLIVLRVGRLQALLEDEIQEEDLARLQIHML